MQAAVFRSICAHYFRTILMLGAFQTLLAFWLFTNTLYLDTVMPYGGMGSYFNFRYNIDQKKYKSLAISHIQHGDVQHI